VAPEYQVGFVRPKISAFLRIGSRRCSRAKCLDQSFTIFLYVGKFFSNFGRQILEKDDERTLSKMKTKIIGKSLPSLGLMFVLVSGITEVHGGSSASSAYPTSPEDVQRPVLTIYSTGDVTRGEIGAFVLDMKPAIPLGGAYVNFSISGTAVPWLDYVPIVSPAYIGPSGYEVMLVETLPDPRGSSFRRAYSLVVTLEHGLGYLIAEPGSAQMRIKP
jgi:hypothetical protein